MDINEFIKKLFERALESGLKDCEVYYSDGTELETGVLNGELINYSSSEFKGLCFRALRDGRMGYASTQVLDEEAIDMLIDGVMTNLDVIEDDDEQFLYDGSGCEKQVSTVSNKTIEETDGTAQIKLAVELEKYTTSLDERVKRVETCEVFSNTETVRIVNTLGLDLTSSSSVFGGYVVPVAAEDDSVNAAGGVWCSVKPDEPGLKAAAKIAAKDAVDGMKAGPVASGKYNIVIRGDAMAELLSAFSDVFSAEAAQKGMSLLKDREGERIASECVTLTDDPTLRGGLASGSFDAEGVTTYMKKVIDKGTFTTLLHDLKTANKQHVKSTGNAAKSGYASRIFVAPSNFYFEPGNYSRDELIAFVNNGLFIYEISGLHCGADSITGDFSVSAHGYVIRNGKLCESVGGITIASNFYNVLKNITAFANDLKFGFPSGSWFGSPSVAVKDISVAGK